jgi:hypothetical protein
MEVTLGVFAIVADRHVDRLRDSRSRQAIMANAPPSTEAFLPRAVVERACRSVMTPFCLAGRCFPFRP